MPATNASFAARAVAPGDELHVDRGGLRVAQPLAAREQLLERVRQQLVRGHVLPAPEQLAGRDLVEDGRHLVVAASRVFRTSSLESLDGALELAVVAARQSDLMAAHHRDRVGDLDGGVLPLAASVGPLRSASGGVVVGRSSGSAVEQIRGAGGVAAVERLNPRPSVVPPGRIVRGDGNRRRSDSRSRLPSLCAIRRMVWYCARSSV